MPRSDMPKSLLAGSFALPAAMILSLTISFIISPLVRRAALCSGVLDIPKDGRRMHTSAVPLAGGAGMIFAFAASLALFSALGDAYVRELVFLCVLCGAYGLADDKFTLRVPAKLAFQTFIAVFAALFLGRAEAFSFFGAEYTLGALSVPVTVLWLVFMMNAVNLTDGVDGLASGTSAVSAAALCVLHLSRGNGAPALCSAVLCGACLGFLFHNRAPAKIFMGETGSAFLGFALGALALPLFSAGEASAFPAVLPVFIFPAGEAVSSFLRRISHGKNPFAPDKKHIHHVLCGKGMPVPLVCAVLYIFALLGAYSAVMYKNHSVFAYVSFALAVVFIRLMLYKHKPSG